MPSNTVMNGYQRAKMTAAWIKQKPEKDGQRVPLETYIKAVCKKNGLGYKATVKKEGAENG